MNTAAGARDLHVVRANGLVVLDQPVSVEYVAFEDELARRNACGLGAVPDRELLAVLFDLPADYPVPRRTLTARQQRLFRRAPDGVVERSRTAVTRLAVPSLRVVHVIAHGRLTASRVREFSRFGPFAARSVEVTGKVTQAIMAEAERFGIALLDDEGDTVVPGRPFVVRRHSPATWLFAELVYAELLGVGALER